MNEWINSVFNSSINVFIYVMAISHWLTILRIIDFRTIITKIVPFYSIVEHLTLKRFIRFASNPPSISTPLKEEEEEYSAQSEFNESKRKKRDRDREIHLIWLSIKYKYLFVIFYDWSNIKQLIIHVFTVIQYKHININIYSTYVNVNEKWKWIKIK